MIHEDKVQIIDFDDSGFGFRLFDVATTLLRNQTEPDYATLKQSLLTGYQSVRNLDLASLDLFAVLRALTYVGWIMSRMNEEGSQERNARFVSTARSLTESVSKQASRIVMKHLSINKPNRTPRKSSLIISQKLRFMAILVKK